MSDFDAVLERLVGDPAFARALAADPAGALAGYRLDPDEVDLLRSQVSMGDAADRTVETRTSKASMMGLLNPFGGIGGGHEHIGRDLGAHVQQGFAPNTHSGFAPVDAGGGGGNPYDGGGNPYDNNPYKFGPGAGEAGRQWPGGGAPESQGAGSAGGVAPLGDQPATGYHPHVDADGDGKWDQYTAVRHADGSVDVFEDRNGDGRVDFVGHDRTGDGIIDSAEYDENYDGHFETRMTDTNGDGWMDTRQQSGR
jgi:hypothetical protein